MSREAKKLLRKNNNSEKQIFKENEEIYTNMIVYLRGADINEYNQEKVREDLIEMIVHGQERGDDIQKVIGDNYKEICDEIIDEMPKKTTKEKVMDVVEMTLDIIWILGFIAVIKTLINIVATDSKDMSFSFMLGDLISWCVIALIANVVVYYVCKTALKDNKNGNSKFLNNKIVSFGIIWLVSFIALTCMVLPMLLVKITLFKVHIGIATLLFGVVFIVRRVMALKY